MLRRIITGPVAVLALVFFVSTSVNAAEFHGRLAGTQFNTDFDTNGDGSYVTEIEGVGRFTHLGKVTARGINEGLPWDGASFCSATELALDTFYFHMVLAAENGELLFTEQSSVELCFDFTDSSWTAMHHFQIVGGTGKFRHATGQFDCDNAGEALFTPLDMEIGYTWETECQGEIELFGSDG
jgi:hypothetical protein